MRLKQRLLILANIIILCISAQAAHNGTLTSKRISTMNGLPSNKVYGMLQDKRGFIWLGTANSLSRYDGYSLLNYDMLGNKKIGQIPAYIREMYYDEQRQLLWAKSRDHYHVCYDIDKGEFIDYTNGGKWDKQYRQLLIENDVRVMFGNENGVRIVTFDSKQNIVCHDYNAANGLLPTCDIRDVVIDEGRNVWILTDKGLYAVTPNGKLRKILAGKFIGGGSTKGKTVVADTRGNVYAYSKTMTPVARIKAMPLGSHGSVKGRIVWRNKLIMFFAHTAVAIDISTLKTAFMPEAFVATNIKYPQKIGGNFFVSSDEGLLKVFCTNGRIKTENLLQNSEIQRNRGDKYKIRHIKGSKYAIATYGNGAFIYDINNGVEQHLSQTDDNPLIDTNLLNDIIIDRCGTIWISQEEVGITKVYNDQNDFFRYILPSPYSQNEYANAIRHILTDGRGKVMMVSKNNVIYKYDTPVDSFAYECTTEYPFYSMTRDRHGNLWTGTRGNGLYIGASQYMNKSALCNLAINDIFDIIEDKYGRMWMASLQSGTEGGLLVAEYERAGGRLKVTRHTLTSMDVHDLDMDANGRLWGASNDGLFCVDTNKKQIKASDIRTFNTTNGMFPFRQLITVKCAGDGSIWAGGTGLGVVKCIYNESSNTLSYQQITVDNGLGSNNVNSLEEDASGYIWAATEGGLARIDSKSGRLYNYRPRNNIKSNYYHENSSLKLPDGRLLFGCNYGVAVIDPTQVEQTLCPDNYELQITDLKINDISIFHKENGSMAPYSAKRIELSHNENTITIQFSHFDYQNPEATAYQYYLEGVDRTWHNITNENKVQYSILPPGTYTFHVRTIGSNNEWTPEKTLTIHIAEPWYNTWWAWMVYIAIIASVAYYLYRNWKEKFNMNQKMKMEQQLIDFRVNFFTQVTHEFRTPLAIIHGAANKLADANIPESRSTIQTMQRGISRLLRLVNQLIEFRRISTDNIQLQVEHGDIIEYVRNIYQDFWHSARQKDILTSFVPFAKQHNMVFDKRIVETVVYNLLSNAVKYTPNGGSYELRIQKVNDSIAISVDDSGNGIDNAQQDSMFEMFMHGRVSQGGMGIGLYAAHKMAKIHKGELTYAQSQTLGGASFTFTIPQSDSAYSPEDYYSVQNSALNVQRPTPNPSLNTEHSALNTADGEPVKEMLPNALNDHLVAIIEDDPDMQDMIKRELGEYFKVVAYSNGKQGYEGVMQEKPALVVCDLMLPDMNGFDIAKKLGNNAATKNIPFIMLTALDDEQTQIKAYQAGVDDYMTKPCNFKVLIARMIQLINWAEHSGSASDNNSDDKLPQKMVMGNLVDKNFLESFQQLVASHLGDSDFTIDTLATMMHMGRTKLYGKVKELTGVTPNKYIMNERMKKAAELLATGEYTVAIVSYKVGLEDASYFNKCFKSYFGISPSKYGK